MAKATNTAKTTLDRTFIHSAKLYGPGEIEADEAIVADLNKAQARVREQDEEYRAARFGELSSQQRAARGELPVPSELPPQRESITYVRTAPAPVPAAPSPKAPAAQVPPAAPLAPATTEGTSPEDDTGAGAPPAAPKAPAVQPKGK